MSEATKNRKAKYTSEAAQYKLGIRRSTREQYEKARKITGLPMVRIADIAIEDFLERRAPMFAKAAS